MAQLAAKKRPILFSAPMVRALLEGQKTQTRRLVKPQPPISNGKDASWRDPKADLWRNARQFARDCCPYGEPGDQLWVREGLIRPDGDPWLYRADNIPVMVNPEDETAMVVWAHHKLQDYCVSIHMPRWASRITLELTDVRVERVQDISEDDAKAEGCKAADPATGRECILSPLLGSHRLHYAALWDKINGMDSWTANPWVWALTFRRLA
jgi:hypothetical protein